MIALRHLRKGLLVGLTAGIAVGISSARYTGSIAHGTLAGTVVALLGALFQGALEAHAERRRSLKGITRTDVPVRPKLVMELRAAPVHLIEICREAWSQPDFRVKRVEIDEPLYMAALTKLSFFSFSERITVKAKPVHQNLSTLEITSVPRLTTTRLDGGVNYTNVFLLSKYVKDRIGTEAVAGERLTDIDVDV